MILDRESFNLSKYNVRELKEIFRVRSRATDDNGTKGRNEIRSSVQKPDWKN